jgi:hypothetical protein
MKVYATMSTNALVNMIVQIIQNVTTFKEVTRAYATTASVKTKMEVVTTLTNATMKPIHVPNIQPVQTHKVGMTVRATMDTTGPTVTMLTNVLLVPTTATKNALTLMADGRVHAVWVIKS